MTEQEYIDATNLAKLRSTKNVLRDVLPMTPAEETLFRKAMIALTEWEDELTKKVKTKD